MEVAKTDASFWLDLVIGMMAFFIIIKIYNFIGIIFLFFLNNIDTIIASN